MRLTATRNASSPASPASCEHAPPDRADDPPAPPRPARGWPAGGAGTPASARSAPRAARSRQRSSCRARLHPNAAQGIVYDAPLLLLSRELCPARFRDAVILALASGLREPPLRRDELLPLQPMQHRVEHPVGPLKLASRELCDPLDDGVAVAIAFRKDREHERRGRGSDQVFTEVHT